MLIYKHPPTVGYLLIGSSFKVGVTKRPAWLHRTLMRLLLGWRWEDVK